MSFSIFHPVYKALNVTYEVPLQSNTVYDFKTIAGDIAKCLDCMQIITSVDFYSF